MGINEEVRLRLLEKRNADLEERHSFEVDQNELLRTRLAATLDRLPEDLRTDLLRSWSEINTAQQRVKNLEAVITHFLQIFETIWLDPDQRMVLRIARAVLQEND